MVMNGNVVPTKPFIAKKSPQYLAALAATVGAFALGNTIGWSSPALPSMQNSTHFPDFDPESEEGSWVASISNLGALIAGLTLGFPLEMIGRKWTMMGLAIPFVAGWLLIGFATNIVMIISGRFITGYCGGAFTLVFPIYTSEIAEDSIRGILGNIMTIVLCSGILFAYAVGALVPWDTLALISASVPIILFVVMWFVPETPRHLLGKAKVTQARVALKKLRGAKSDYQVELELSQITQSMEESQSSSASLKDLLDPPVLKPTLISIAIMFLQQFGGINAVLFFATTIFGAAKTDMSNDVQSIVVAAVQVASVIVSTLLIERAGRKILLVISDAGMGLSLVALGTFFYLNEKGEAGSLGWLPLTSLVVYIIAYNLGLGPLAWTMLGELIPPHVKSLASSIAMALCWGMAFVITKNFPSMVTTLNNYGCFWLFSAISLAGSIFCLLFVPETKGKSLDEIQQLFQR